MPGILQRWLRISPAETTFAGRGFHNGRNAARAKMERVGENFLRGYHAALADVGLEALSQQLAEIELEFRGFGFEGAAMALDILDQLQPWKVGRVQRFLSGPGKAHVYMVHVGVGWSLARFRFFHDLRLSRFDPLLRWLVLDGFGFHEGYFHWKGYADGALVPNRLRGYGLRSFDQGLGRSLWFVSGADPEYITLAMKPFPDSRRGDLWSGVGLACSYAGGSDAAEMEMLRVSAGPYWPHMAQGAVFAAAARERAGNPAPHTDLACRLLCRLTSREAAELSQDALATAVEDAEPLYEVWRRQIRARFRAPGNSRKEPPAHLDHPPGPRIVARAGSL
jgi:hypothetical protein